MWWMPLATAAFLAVLVGLLHMMNQRRLVSVSRKYRSRFVQLVAQLETVTGSANELGALARQINDVKVLDYYEATLRILETLLAAIKRIPPFGNDPGLLESAFFLVRDCRERIGRTRQAFQDLLRGRDISYDELFGGAAGAQRKIDGCYFCSRPMIASRFSKVKVRLDGEIKEVPSCRICREELENTKKVKVLHFMKDGRPAHWSQVSDYQPSEDYWNINSPEGLHKRRRLELIYSAHDAGSLKDP